LTADEEDNYIIAGANTPLNDDGSFKENIILARQKEDNVEVTPDKIDYMDVIPKQVVSVASACIPFLENDDSNRALMGANQQRQAAFDQPTRFTCWYWYGISCSSRFRCRFNC
jgi:DNA-directed RNA polymerase subunit beta